MDGQQDTQSGPRLVFHMIKQGFQCIQVFIQLFCDWVSQVKAIFLFQVIHSTRIYHLLTILLNNVSFYIKTLLLTELSSLNINFIKNTNASEISFQKQQCFNCKTNDRLFSVSFVAVFLLLIENIPISTAANVTCLLNLIVPSRRTDISSCTGTPRSFPDLQGWYIQVSCQGTLGLRTALTRRPREEKKTRSSYMGRVLHSGQLCTLQ